MHFLPFFFGSNEKYLQLWGQKRDNINKLWKN